jgi:hypothetical protein
VPPLAFGSSLSAAQRARADNFSLYLDNALNTDSVGASCPDTGEIGAGSGSGLLTGAATCDQYTAPNGGRRDRDRVHMLGAATAASCSSNGQQLAAAAPCGTAWTVSNPTCVVAMPNLDACSCASAARVLARPPCTNNVNPAQCQAALAQLKSCS